LKFVDNQLTTNAPSAGIMNLLNGVAAGTDFTQRVGRKFTMKSIWLKYFLNPLTTTATPAGDLVRVMVIYDTQTNGTIPAVTDVLATANVLSSINLNNRDRFKIIHDKWHSMNPSNYAVGVPTAGAPVVKFQKFFKVLNLETIFSGTAATVGSIATGAMFSLLISAANNQSNLNLDVRFRFIDN